MVKIIEALAKEYASALVASSGHEKRSVNVEESFDDMKAWMPRSRVEHHTAEELVEYMMR